HDVGAIEQRLGRDAADVEAGAAELFVLLDAQGGKAVFAGANRRPVAARATANHSQIVGLGRSGHGYPLGELLMVAGAPALQRAPFTPPHARYNALSAACNAPRRAGEVAEWLKAAV